MGVKSKIYRLIDFNNTAEKAIARSCHIYRRGGVVNRALALLYHRHNRKKYGIEIYPTVSLGTGVKIPHAVGIVIGKTAVIGDRTTIFPGVKIVARYSPRYENPSGRRHAVIEKDCILGANSTIIGDITIGEGSVIGAGALVTKDVPPRSVIIKTNQLLRRLD